MLDNSAGVNCLSVRSLPSVIDCCSVKEGLQPPEQRTEVIRSPVQFGGYELPFRGRPIAFFFITVSILGSMANRNYRQFVVPP